MYFATLLATWSKSFCFAAGLAVLGDGQKYRLILKSSVQTLILGTCVFYIDGLFDLAEVQILPFKYGDNCIIWRVFFFF